MSAMVAFTTPTISALSASVSVTGAPSGPLISSVLPSTFSIVPFTRCVCCADALVTAMAAAKAAAVKIRMVFMSFLPRVGAGKGRLHRGTGDAKGLGQRASGRRPLSLGWAKAAGALEFAYGADPPCPPQRRRWARRVSVVHEGGASAAFAHPTTMTGGHALRSPAAE